MSFASRATKQDPTGRDSKDTAKLRAEYDRKAAECRDSRDSATKAKLKDEKQKAFTRVVEQVTAERRDNLAGLHKVLIQQGKLKTKEQVEAERAAGQAAIAARAGK